MWVSFDMAVDAYLYVCMARIYFRVALIRKYLYIYIYIEVFSCNLEPRFTFWHIYLLGWAEMKFLCRYTNSETCSPISYVYGENICMPPCMSLEF